MRTRSVLLALVLLATFVGAGLAPERKEAPQAISELEFEVVHGNGRVVQMHFLVRARDDAEAHAAVLAAVRSSGSGARLVDGDVAVSAVRASWGWTWDPDELPLQVAYNPAGAPESVPPEVVTEALAIWSEAPESGFAFDYQGFTHRPPSLYDGFADGKNTIGWVRMDCTFGCVLGITSKDNNVHEVDIALNSNPAAGLGDGSDGTLDSFTVILHEAGHMAGLDHSCPESGQCTPAQEAAVMYYRYRGENRALHKDDIARLSALYPATAQPDTWMMPAEVAPGRLVRLQPGWNLVVLPPGPLAEVVATLACAQAVYSPGESGWSAWIRGVVAPLQGIAYANGGHAYWVFASTSCEHSFAQ
jgi:hypothetical protein